MKMITREVVESVILYRDGKRVILTTGQKFSFTEDECAQITKMSPKALSAKSLVDLDSGDADLTKQGSEPEPTTVKKPDETTPAKAGGKKAAQQPEGDL